MNIKAVNGNTVIENLKNFNLAQTLDCGQAFRWSEREDGCWSGIAYGREVVLQKQRDTLTVFNMDVQEFNSIWRKYFDLDRDYASIVNACQNDRLLKISSNYGNGIRVLCQEPWETLCSFIISQNNNIPRIKGIIDRLCENFGKKIVGGYSFPSPQDLAALEVEDLSPLRSGFRAKYIIDAARKVSSGEVDLESLREMPYEEAQQQLMLIKGVGPKVADCTLLFGLGKVEAFPKDVWIKRVMSTYFPNGIPAEVEPYAGIVQQYLFFYARTENI